MPFFSSSSSSSSSVSLSVSSFNGLCVPSSFSVADELLNERIIEVQAEEERQRQRQRTNDEHSSYNNYSSSSLSSLASSAHSSSHAPSLPSNRPSSALSLLKNKIRLNKTTLKPVKEERGRTDTSTSTYTSTSTLTPHTGEERIDDSVQFQSFSSSSFTESDEGVLSSSIAVDDDSYEASTLPSPHAPPSFAHQRFLQQLNQTPLTQQQYREKEKEKEKEKQKEKEKEEKPAPSHHALSASSSLVPSSDHLILPSLSSSSRLLLQFSGVSSSFSLSPRGTFSSGAISLSSQGVGIGDEYHSLSKESLIFLHVLGRGASGVVYKCLHIPSMSLIALKSVSILEKDKRQQMLKEIHTLSRLKHSSLVEFKGAYIDGESVYIGLKYYNGGNLDDYIKQYGHMNEEQLARVFHSLITGLGHLHSSSILHRDLKVCSCSYQMAREGEKEHTAR